MEDSARVALLPLPQNFHEVVQRLPPADCVRLSPALDWRGREGSKLSRGLCMRRP